MVIWANEMYFYVHNLFLCFEFMLSFPVISGQFFTFCVSFGALWSTYMGSFSLHYSVAIKTIGNLGFLYLNDHSEYDGETSSES